ncbi:hypothetical protein ABVT39_004997 [Epinephelus coioides]
MERRKNAVKMKPLMAYFQNREEDEGDNGRDLNEDESDKEHPDHIHEEDRVSKVERSQSDSVSEGEGGRSRHRCRKDERKLSTKKNEDQQQLPGPRQAVYPAAALPQEAKPVAVWKQALCWIY